MSSGHIYLSRQLPPLAMTALRELPWEVQIGLESAASSSREQLIAGIRGASAAIVMLTDRIDDEVLAAAGQQLRVVANVAVGFDNVDIASAKRRGVVVTNTPGVLDEATADLAFGLLLATVRRIVEADRFVRSGESWSWEPQGYLGLDVSADAQLGIVGLGRTGMAMARRARAFGMNVVATGRRSTTDEARLLGIEAIDLPALLRTSDVVSLHCPLTPENRHMIGSEQLHSMKRGSYLINTARGPLVDEEALADALDSGHIAGAGLDVHEFEPAVNVRLRRSPSTVLLPHIGSAGLATREAMGALAVRNVAQVLRGEGPLTPVASERCKAADSRSI